MSAFRIEFTAMKAIKTTVKGTIKMIAIKMAKC